VSKELSYDLDAEDVKEITQKAKELLKSGKAELQELNEAIQDDKKYDFIDNHYIIYTQVNSKEGKVKQKYTLPVDLIDGIFNDFSKH